MHELLVLLHHRGHGSEEGIDINAGRGRRGDRDRCSGLSGRSHRLGRSCRWRAAKVDGSLLIAGKAPLVGVPTGGAGVPDVGLCGIILEQILSRKAVAARADGLSTDRELTAGEVLLRDQTLVMHLVTQRAAALTGLRAEMAAEFDVIGVLLGLQEVFEESPGGGASGREGRIEADAAADTAAVSASEKFGAMLLARDIFAEKRIVDEDSVGGVSHFAVDCGIVVDLIRRAVCRSITTLCYQICQC